MSSTRRQFLRVAMTGAATLPLAGKLVASDLLTAPADLQASDAALLNDIERAAFEYFWNEANPARMGEVTVTSPASRLQGSV